MDSRKPCQLTIDTGALVTISRADIVAGKPERKPSRTCLTDCLWRVRPVVEGGLCRTESGTSGPENPCVRRGGYGRVHPGVRCPVGLRRVRGRRTTFASTGPGGVNAMETMRPTKSCQALTAGDELIPARCDRVVMARLEAPLGPTNILIEPRLNCSRDGLFIARALVRGRPKVPVRIMNVTSAE